MEPFKPMEPLDPRQPASEPVQMPRQETPENGYYHGVGAGQKEPIYGGTPYFTYDTYHSYQPPAPEPAPVRKPRKKRHIGKKLLKGVAALLAAAVLVAASSAITAGLTSLYWSKEYNTMRQYLNEKTDALQDQINTLENTPTGSGGVLDNPAETLTAGEIYQQNVNSVVAITCAVNTTVNGQSVVASSAGTGFIVTEDGYIATNHHVIEGASAITVTMADGSEYAALLIGSDSANDVAVIKIQASGLQAVTLGASSALQVGDQVVAIGNALGELSSSLTVGYVSGMDRDVTTDGSIINMLQTDVAINSGNSGGPLFNAKGEVIGITTAKYSGTTTSGASIEGIGFAIPIDDVRQIIEDLVNYGYIKSAYLGIMASDVNPTDAEYYGFPVGVYVSSTVPGYCAAEAGLQSRDIIIELAGYEVTCMNDLGRVLRSLEPGERVTVVVWRSGQELILHVTLDEKPQS